MNLEIPSVASINTLTQRDEYKYNPVSWVRNHLKEFVWSKQEEILNSIRDNRRTAVKSCHGSGKSWLAGRAVAWWLSVHPPGTARVITSAPSGPQVKAILWQEIGRAHSRGNLPGRLNQTEWWIEIKSPDGRTIREEMVGIGRKPSEHNPSAFQGIHERYVLVVFDEADGMPKPLWDAADGLLSNDECRLLSIGNPEDPMSEFANECKPGSGANVIKISAFDTPNFTGEKVPGNVRHKLVSPTWVDEKKRRWGETNPLYIAKVLGEFPEHSTDGLFPIQWIRAAQERILMPSFPIGLGVDVGGGGDKNVICRRQGKVFRIILRDHTPNTMTTLSNTLNAIAETGATYANIDNIGIGWGAADRAQEMVEDQQLAYTDPGLVSRAKKIYRTDVGGAAQDRESFVNRRAEGYWALRERFQNGNIDIDATDEDLAAQLVAIKYKRSAGKIQIQSKKEMAKSPDEADALMLANMEPSEDEGVEATW